MWKKMGESFDHLRLEESQGFTLKTRKKKKKKAKSKTTTNLQFVCVKF